MMHRIMQIFIEHFIIIIVQVYNNNYIKAFIADIEGQLLNTLSPVHSANCPLLCQISGYHPI